MKLGEHYQANVICVADLLRKEVVKKTKQGLVIEQFIKGLQLVPDNIVVDLLYKHLQTLQDDQSIIIEGFPKTKLQGISLIQKGIIPDSIVFLNAKEN